MKDQFNKRELETIEKNYFCDMLNQRMEKSNMEYFTMSFQIRNLYFAFVKKAEKGDEYASAAAFSRAYDEVFKCMQIGNHYFSDYEKKKHIESVKFSGKQEDGMVGSETAS